MSKAFQNSLIAVFILGSLACTRSNSKNEESSLQGAEPVVNPSAYLRLQTFPNCASTDSYVRENIRRTLKEGFDQQRYGLEHWKSGVYDTRADGVTTTEASAPSSSGAAKDAASGPGEFSKTNLQVAGVDEPDSMKTDGKTIYSISGSNIQITASWPVQDMQKIGSIAIAGQPLGLLLTEDSKLVVAYHPALTVSYPNKDITTSAPAYYETYPWGPRFGNPQVVKIAIYQVSEPAQPQLVKEFQFWGNYLNMRRQGKMLRLVQSVDSYYFQQGLVASIDTSFYRQLPNGAVQYGQISLDEFDRLRAEAEKKNEQVLAALSFKAQLQKLLQDRGMSSDDPLLSDTYDCTQIYASPELGEYGFTTVTSVDLQEGTLAQAAVMAPARQLYASEGGLYLAHTAYKWWTGPESSFGSKTYIHRFKYESLESLKINYQGSGMVNGYLLNQFAMDEYQDVLRVAITEEITKVETSGSSDAPSAARSSVMVSMNTANRVLTLGQGPEGLVELGRTPDLAPGERIFGIRFHQDKGFMVTFRQVDPLYTLDLRDPKAPKVVGELKVTGYSAYIHLLDDSHLLTVGEEADPNTGRRMGLKIAVFDVSDLSKPTEKYKHVVGGDFSWSEALYDHHAFNYFASKKLLALPISGYRPTSANSTNWWDQYYAELQVFSVDLAKGIEAKGAVSVNDLYQGQSMGVYDWQWMAIPSRSVFADDYIYAISNFGISAVQQQDLTSTVKAARFYP